jgi:hypothetical protein
LLPPSPSVSKPFITITSSCAGLRSVGGSMMNAP